MATNTGKNTRKGAVKERTQFPHPNNPNHFLKRNRETGQIMSGKKDDYKGVAHEIDKRRK